MNSLCWFLEGSSDAMLIGNKEILRKSEQMISLPTNPFKREPLWSFTHLPLSYYLYVSEQWARKKIMTSGLWSSPVTRNQSVISWYIIFLLLIIHSSGVRQLLKSINLIVLFKLKDVARVKDKKYIYIEEESSGEFWWPVPAGFLSPSKVSGIDMWSSASGREVN